ncbi:unnamed protein product [Pipistrellus nathusii]|uniref:Intercellular adhesion molecule N-terminal domain-containing protein n=1 Tax=Pipistrellus nathusii TaxID=59473 RepID=A0ABN9ZPC0_PIPNA
MAPLCRWGLPAALLALLLCPGAGVAAFDVYASPEQLVVRHGASSEINCSTSCLQPTIGGLETTMSKVLLDKQPQWERYRVSNFSTDTIVYCHFTCSGKQMLRNISVTVFHPPEQVLLKLQPTWVTVGRAFTMECRVPAVAPLEDLTLTLLRGQEPLHTKTFGGATAAPQEASVTHNSTAHKDDGRHNFSCRAELDLRPRGGVIIRRTSEPQALEIHEPMPDNQMVIIIAVVSVLLLLFVASVLLCFVFGQQWHQRRRGNYGVQAAWRRLRRSFRA